MHYLDNSNDNTADSLAFLERPEADARRHRSSAGLLAPSRGTQPVHVHPHRHPRHTIWLSGPAAGYHGEGPRAALQTLLECGFPNRDAQQVLTRSPVRLQREPEPPPPVRQIDPRLAQREASQLCRSRAGYDVRDR